MDPIDPCAWCRKAPDTNGSGYGDPFVTGYRCPTRGCAGQLISFSGYQAWNYAQGVWETARRADFEAGREPSHSSMWGTTLKYYVFEDYLLANIASSQESK